MMLRILLIHCLALAIGMQASAADLIVPSKDYPTIQSAIAVANGGDHVVVLPGTYFELINFQGKAITVRSSSGPGVTTIHGGGLGPVVQCVSGEGPGSVLQGFTITGGNASSGGGMYNFNSSPTVTNCDFINNSATFGGGLHNNNSNPNVTGCRFIDNHAVANPPFQCGGGGGM
ncbi:MAG: hypothetical protein IID30_12740, partial [Planctomycetes bacterium]|nr:hypothetical protein [Planctomycetota bacterium]